MSSAYMGNELRALRDTLGLTELGRAFMTKHTEIFFGAAAPTVTPSQDATALADEPRFFIDHDMVHDRQTGKHVTTEPDSAFNDGILRCCELLNALAEGREPKPFPLLFDNNWLEEKIKTDPDIDCEVGALRATSQTPDAVREENWECSCGGDPKCPNPCRSTPSASAGPQQDETIEQLCEGITDENRHPEIPVSALVPDGFALVPIEPTKEMIQASIWALDRWREKNGNVQGFVPPGEKYQIRWRAMLAAAASAGPQAEAVAWRYINSLGEIVSEWIDGRPPERLIDVDGVDFTHEVTIQRAYAHPQPQQADERGAVIEECARVCDWVAEANEIRGKTLPSQSNAQSAAFDKSESAARCAKAVRALQQSPTTERAQAPNFTSQLLDPTNHPD